MNILFLAQRVPEPPNKGDKIRSHHFMRRLAERHAVHVACLVDEPSEARFAADAARWASSVTWKLRRSSESAWRGAASALTGNPISVGFFHSKSLAREIDRRLAADHFDVVVAYCSSMAGYLERYSGAKVLDFVDVDSEKWKQYADRSGWPKRAIYALEHRLLRAYERRLVREYDRCIIISPQEKKILSEFADPNRVDVVSNGVDTAWWERSAPRPPAPVLVFVGALDYFANEDGIVDFARNVFPGVRAGLPEAELRIVGRKPGPAVQALAAIAGVTVVGEVDDVRPELWKASIAVVPLRIAQGLQNKVLEAMAAGAPVVSTNAAIRGIEGDEGTHFLRADEPEEFVAAITGLHDDASRADRQAKAARELVCARYSWDRKAREYEAVLEAAAASRRETVAVGGSR